MARNTDNAAAFETLGYLASVMGSARPNRIDCPNMTTADLHAVFQGYDRAKRESEALIEDIDNAFRDSGMEWTGIGGSVFETCEDSSRISGFENTIATVNLRK